MQLVLVVPLQRGDAKADGVGCAGAGDAARVGAFRARRQQAPAAGSRQLLLSRCCHVCAAGEAAVRDAELVTEWNGVQYDGSALQERIALKPLKPVQRLRRHLTHHVAASQRGVADRQ